jgi:hypothetical protein
MSPGADGTGLCISPSHLALFAYRQEVPGLVAPVLSVIIAMRHCSVSVAEFPRKKPNLPDSTLNPTKSAAVERSDDPEGGQDG